MFLHLSLCVYLKVFTNYTLYITRIESHYDPLYVLETKRKWDLRYPKYNLSPQNLKNLRVVTPEPAADDTTPRLVIDSTNPPYIMLLIISTP